MGVYVEIHVLPDINMATERARIVPRAKMILLAECRPSPTAPDVKPTRDPPLVSRALLGLAGSGGGHIDALDTWRTK